MSSRSIDLVIGILQKANYRLIKGAIPIASVEFEFAAILVGTEKSSDLILVIDAILEPELRIRQKIEGFSRALDVAASRRPVTAIIVGPRPSSSTLEMLGRVCRVLAVGTHAGVTAEATLREWLSVLLPLPLPDLNVAIADPRGELVAALPVMEDRRIIPALLAAAANGPNSVKVALRQIIETPIADNKNLSGSQ